MLQEEKSTYFGERRTNDLIHNFAERACKSFLICFKTLKTLIFQTLKKNRITYKMCFYTGTMIFFRYFLWKRERKRSRRLNDSPGRNISFSKKTTRKKTIFRANQRRDETLRPYLKSNAGAYFQKKFVCDPETTALSERKRYRLLFRLKINYDILPLFRGSADLIILLKPPIRVDTCFELATTETDK